MTGKKMLKGCRNIVVLLLLLSAGAVRSQEAIDTVASLPGIEIEVSANPAEIFIGDLVTYKITVRYDSTYQLIPPPLGANLGAFDVKDYESDIETRLPDGRIQSDNVFILSTFTTGDYVIPPIPVVFNLPDSSSKVLFSDGVPIKVLSLLANAGDSVDIKPLKAQYEFPRDLTDYYFWGSIIGGVILAFLVLAWLRKHRRMEEREPLDLRPAWEIAFERLAFLKQKDLCPEGKFKEYYTELTDILRTYYESMYQINALDMTTGEFLEAFGEKELPREVFERTEALLRHADLAKFAKFQPELERTEKDFDDTHWLVEEVRADYDRRLRPQLNIIQSDSSAPTEEVTP